MGLGRITRFAPTPPGARRVPVMRRGTRGLKILAPSEELLRDFHEEKLRLRAAGVSSGEAHAEACRRIDYRRRYREEFRARPGALDALRVLVREARSGDVYLMCMCPYRTPDRACHTYLLLDLAAELDPGLTLLAEPPLGTRLPPAKR